MGHESGKRPRLEPEPKPPRDPEAEQGEHRAFNLVVGEGIRRARRAHGWTQALLATHARLSPNYVARLERGELGPSLFVANRICEALDIAVEELFGPSSAGSGRKTAGRRRGQG